jgi:hypothetical protein
MDMDAGPATRAPALRPSANTRVSILVLPRAVMELVLSFALKDVAVEVRPVKRKGWRRLARPKVPIEAFSRWCVVCRDWDAMVRDIIAQYRTRTFKASLSHKTPLQQEDILESLRFGGESVQDLRIALFGHQNGHRGAAAQSNTIDWLAVLGRCPNLQRLDVSKMMFLTRLDMIALLDAAARCCLKLQVLLLPLPLGWTKHTDTNNRGGRRPNNDSAEDDALIEALGRALEQWFVRGPNRGLRQLMVPHLARNSNELISSIAKFCPKIELLDGWKLTYLNDGWGAVTCDDEWHLSLEVWELFCRNCTNIREFNWVVAPFADAFLVPFGRATKHRLTELSLDFTDAFEVLNSPASSASSPDGICMMLQGLPFLKRLKLSLHPRSRIEVNVFSDQVLASLARYSPYLELFSITEAGQYKGGDAIESISSEGISQLSTMPHLSDITVEAVQCGSQCDFSIFVRTLPPTVRQRNVKIGVLQDFEDCVLPLVWDIAEQPPGTFDNRAFAVLLVNQGYRRGISKTPSSPQHWESRMLEVQAALQDQHPNVRFQLTFEKQRTRLAPRSPAKEVYCMSKFSVFTSNWVYPDMIGGTFYRGDIIYNSNENKVPFSWIMKFG